MSNRVEIIEWFDSTDVCTAKVLADLPAGYYCRITRNEKCGWDVKTKNGCKPSIRYYFYKNLEDAYAFGVRWADRQHRVLASIAR